ncbi:predicted protein [Streptomyces viridochromogenes DSM 40736]|uniref:Predicted protein n=1 Tax=Streptomyces viridochromogenes (strain DSM 40736 / JCM 4977 / BCRC 1201 / Tue 494) TaxID=591159 RepID=D9WX64_STRVT|nr:hypothetical protein [Streptomyces viridochromogenes]EFL30877.1 predicted protein [Streptomyces viridochromogenes DSM 40736]
MNADFAAEVAQAALAMGQAEVTKAETRAAEAVKAADAAEAAAARANAEVGPAFKAAAAAARSSADAARSSVAAMKSAAQAAEDGAKARAAAARANEADAQAQADAKLARQAANEAFADAAAARNAATQAEAEAARARGAATEAENHAAAASSAATLAEKEASVAQGAAAQAEKDAADADKLATSAEEHAKSAETAAKNAGTYAKEADEAAKRAEEYQREQERKEREEAARSKENGDPYSLEEAERAALEAAGISEAEYEAARALAQKDLLDYLKENGAELLVELAAEEIKECWDDPDISTCLWAVVSNLPWAKAVKLVGKLPKIGKAIWGIKGFLDKSAEAKKLVDKGEKILEDVWKKLPACVTDRKKKGSAAQRSARSVDGAHHSSVMAGGGSGAGDLGLAREEFIAKLVGGKVAKGENGQDIPIVMPNVGSSGLDVIGPNGEYIFVGGGAKAANPSKFGKALKINKYAADEAGVKAIYYLADNTPESAIKQAKKVFGDENVHIFTLPSC